MYFSYPSLRKVSMLADNCLTTANHWKPTTLFPMDLLIALRAAKNKLRSNADGGGTTET